MYYLLITQLLKRLFNKSKVINPINSWEKQRQLLEQYDCMTRVKKQVAEYKILAETNKYWLK